MNPIYYIILASAVMIVSALNFLFPRFFLKVQINRRYDGSDPPKSAITVQRVGSAVCFAVGAILLVLGLRGL